MTQKSTEKEDTPIQVSNALIPGPASANACLCKGKSQEGHKGSYCVPMTVDEQRIRWLTSPNETLTAMLPADWDLLLVQQ